jgi:peroxiredoxin
MQRVIAHYFNLRFFLSFLFLLAGCGLKPAGSYEAVIPSHSDSASVVLYVFSAPWCAECNRELPSLKQKYLTELTVEQQQRVSVSIYVVTGKTPGQVATQEAADEYGKSLELPFTMIADKYYKTYRQYFEEGNAIPAAVLMDGSKQILKTYEAGTTDLEDLFSKIKTNLK